MSDKSPTTEPLWQPLEEAGYEAGLAGQDIHQARGWSNAWNDAPGTNSPIYIMAGWVAGRAMRRILKETGHD